MRCGAGRCDSAVFVIDSLTDLCDAARNGADLSPFPRILLYYGAVRCDSFRCSFFIVNLSDLCDAARDGADLSPFIRILYHSVVWCEYICEIRVHIHAYFEACLTEKHVYTSFERCY